MSDRVVVMFGGRIAQMGTPTEIYDRPATRQVAGFVGQVNVLEGTVMSVSDGSVHGSTFPSARSRSPAPRTFRRACRWRWPCGPRRSCFRRPTRRAGVDASPRATTPETWSITGSRWRTAASSTRRPSPRRASIPAPRSACRPTARGSGRWGLRHGCGDRHHEAHGVIGHGQAAQVARAVPAHPAGCPGAAGVSGHPLHQHRRDEFPAARRRNSLWAGVVDRELSQVLLGQLLPASGRQHVVDRRRRHCVLPRRRLSRRVAPGAGHEQAAAALLQHRPRAAAGGHRHPLLWLDGAARECRRDQPDPHELGHHGWTVAADV